MGRRGRPLGMLAAVALGLVPCATATVATAVAAPEGIHKIQHVIVLMQENRSFDHVLRHLSGRQRDPGGRVRAGPAARRLRRAVSRLAPTRTTAVRTARRLQRHGHRRRARWTASSTRPRAGQQCTSTELPAAARAALRGERETVRGRDGLSRRARDPQLLDLRAELRAPGQHVRARSLVELAGAPLPGLRLVGSVLQTATRTDGLHEQLARPHAALDRHRPERDICRGPTSPTCSTRPG